MSATRSQAAYVPACSNSAGRTDVSGSLLQTGYKPTLEECAVLAAPIANFLSQCTCYDMLGMSTLVVVLDVEAPLSIAFIAAQETRVQSCVLWDPRHRQYMGVLTSTDYIKILLYCDAHPTEAEAVSSWTIRHWWTMKDKMETFVPPGSKAAGLREVRPGPQTVITCGTEASLKECLTKMRDYGVRRVVALAEKEAEGFSVVAVMDVEQIVEYLGMLFFHLEKARRALDGGDLAGEDGGSGGDARREGAGEELTPVGGFSMSDSLTLPAHVTSILAQAEASDATQSDVHVGPYKSIFDIPFLYVPHLGQHRSTPIYVTMESKLNDALLVLLKYDIESVAVCTAGHVVVGVLSRSDLLRMEDQGVYDTNRTVRESLMSIIGGSVFVFYEKDTLRDIFAHFVQRRVKELFLVDPDTGKLKGQLNVSEFAFFLVFATAGSRREIAAAATSSAATTTKRST